MCACGRWTLCDTGETFWRAKRNYSKLNNNAKTARTKKILKSRSHITWGAAWQASERAVCVSVCVCLGAWLWLYKRLLFFALIVSLSPSMCLYLCVCLFCTSKIKLNSLSPRPTKLYVFVYVSVYNRAHSVVAMFGYVCVWAYADVIMC